ncbi:MAG: superoxide dismutase family protein [Pseudomonadota bacterium]
MRVSLAVAIAPLIAACAHDAQPAQTFEPAAFTAVIAGPTGASIGDASLVQGPHGMMVEINLGPGSVDPGWHGVHFHMVGDCSDIGVYKLSGGHVGLIEGGHGLMNPIGPEDGDLPNIHVNADGGGSAEMFTQITSLADLLDADGSALVIHADRDDHISQPIGNAGARVACAEIINE